MFWDYVTFFLSEMEDLIHVLVGFFTHLHNTSCKNDFLFKVKVVDTVLFLNSIIVDLVL